MRPNHLVLVIPGLLAPPQPDGDAAWTTQRAPHLARLLAAAGAPADEPDGIDGALAALYGIARQRDWPLGPIRAHALGLDTGNSFWLCADPVTLVAGRDNVRLGGSVANLAARDADALLATLNAHFAEDGLAFVAPRPDQWFARTAVAPAITTRPLAAALARTLRDLLPTGPDAGRWRRWQDEIQMLLHDHPANAARAQQGQAPVTAVWLWGGGTLPSPAPTAMVTYGDDRTTVALAAFTGSPARALPAALDEAIAAARDGVTCVVAGDHPASPDDAERTASGPAWRALQAGTVATVSVITDGDGGALRWTARRPSAFRRLTSRWKTPDLARNLAAVRAQRDGER